MITIIVLLSLLSVVSFIAAQAASTFRGSSTFVFNSLNIAGGFGYLAFIVFVIWGFFKFPWWVSTISLVAPFIIVPFITPLVRMVIPRIISIIAVPVLIILLTIIYYGL